MHHLPVSERIRTPFKLIASAEGAAMDFGVGALIAVLLAEYFAIEPSWALLVLGSFMAVLPDTDIMLPSLSGRTIHYNHHEMFTHRPLFMIPTATIIAYGVGSFLGEEAYAATLTFLCVTWHFIHDTPGGIAWLWPFSGMYLSPWGKVEIEAQSDPASSHMHFLHSFLTPTISSIFELSVCALAMGSAINIVTQSLMGTILSLCGVFFVILTWTLYHVARTQFVRERKLK